MAILVHRRLEVRLGFATETGLRAANEDYVAASFGPPPGKTGRTLVAAVADGVGGHKGGRIAAETSVGSFIEAFFAMPETLGVRRAASRSIEAINSWIRGQGRSDPNLQGMSCTFSALILTRRAAHIVHVGDSRIYRLSDGRLDRLTTDHTAGRGDLSHMLQRAIGFDDFVKFDYQAIGLRPHDRFLICTDGVHGVLDDRKVQALLEDRSIPDDVAKTIVETAIASGSADNATALVLDVVDLPPVEQDELTDAISSLPVLDLPEPGETVDGFLLGPVLSDGRYSRLFRASDADQGRPIVLKFPHPRVASDSSYRLAFVREGWVAARVRSPHVGEIVELPAGRQSRLYSAMPFYDGETLEDRLKREPPVTLAEGVSIASKIARAITALHRAGIIHRDIKPDNVILLRDGGLRVIDLGVARIPNLEDFPAEDIPGTASFMAPELFLGHAGDEGSDLYALGATVYRMFTRGWPYGEVEPFSKPRFRKYTPLSQRRPDLPAWLDVAVSRAVAIQPAQRYGDVLEFAYELEHGASLARPVPKRLVPLYERNPLIVWKIATALLVVLCIALAAKR